MDTVDAARELAPLLRARADEIEEVRRIPADLAQRFARAGFHRLFVPAAYGGLEAAPAEMLSIVETLARADGSAAWCVFIHATSGSVLAYVPEADAREIFAGPETTLAGVFAPQGEAVAEGEMYRVNGRWQWASGSQNAHWIMGGCRVIRDGEVECTPRGAPIPRLLLAPARDVVLFDTWNAIGLCGTGSTEFAMEDLLVPRTRTVALSVDRPLEGPLYQFPNFALLALGIAGVALGLARRSIDELVRLAAGKTPQGASRSLANRPHTQVELARAEAALRSGRAFLDEAVGAAWDRATSGGFISLELRRDLRLATTWATRSAARAVDRMYELAGGSSVHRSSPLGRAFRDVHVATQHMMVATATYELTGRLLLGLETDTTFL